MVQGMYPIRTYKILSTTGFNGGTTYNVIVQPSSRIDYVIKIEPKIAMQITTAMKSTKHDIYIYGWLG